MMSTSVSYAMSASAMAFRTRPEKSLVRGVRLPCGHHRHARDPARDRLVEFLLHGELAARPERRESCDPGEHFVGAAPGRLANLIGVERIGAPDLAAAQDLHDLFV